MSLVGRTTQQYSGFSPDTVSGLSLWLDAADTNSIVLASGTSNVTQWRDKSGTNKSVSFISAPSYNPTGFNGLPAFTFANGNRLSITTPAFGQTVTLIAVYKISSSVSSNSVVLSVGSALSTTETGIGWNVNTSSYNIYDFGFGESLNTSINSKNIPIIHIGVKSSTNLISYINGVTGPTASSTYSNQNTTIFIGNSSWGFIGDLAEVLIYSTPLTTSERQAIEGYLSRKWMPLDVRSTIPSSIPGLSLWLDAADTSTLTLSGSNVTQWMDKSGNGYHATQPSSSLRPIYSNRGVRFIASSNTNLEINVPYSTNHSIFMVATPSPGTGGAYLFGRQVGSGSSPAIIINYNGTALEYFDIGSDRFTFKSSTSQESIFLVNYTRQVGGNIVGFFNGTQVFSNPQTNTGDTTSAWQTIGNAHRTSYQNYYNGVIYEFIIYPYVLSTTQRQAIEGYLTHKWLTSLPLAHPYRRLPPITRPFQPFDVPNLSLWLDAADRSTLTLSGSNVTQWRDKSGNNRHASNTSTTQPTYSSTSNAIVFNGTQRLTGASTQLVNPTNGTWTVFAIASTTRTGVIQNIFDGDNAGSTARVAQFIRFDSNNRIESIGFTNTGNAFFAYGPTTYTSNVQYLLTGLNEVSAITTFINGTAGTTTSHGTNVTAATPFTVGAYTSPTSQSVQLLSGNVHEVLCFSTSLTTTQRQSIEFYLSRKWGVPIPSAASSPSNIPGLSLWLDAADSSTVTLSGSNVTQWNDKSGNGRNAVGNLGTGTYNPTGLNSLPCIEITSTGNMVSSIPPGTFSAGLAVFVVFQKTGANNSFDTIVTRTIGHLPAPLDIYTTSSQTGRLSGDGISNVRSLTNGTLARNTNPTIWFANVSPTLGSTWQETVNGTLSTYSVSTNYGDTSTKFHIGTRDDGFTKMNGRISEILLYNLATLTTAQRQSIELYLSQKWGLSAPPRYKQLTLAFVPGALSGLTLWFDAADTSTITGTSNATSWVSKGSSSAIATVFAGTPTTGNIYNGLNYLRFPAGSEMRFTTALSPQPRTWFAVARNTTQLTSTNPFWGPTNQTAGNGQDAGIIVVRASNGLYESGIGPSGITIHVRAQNIPNPFNEVNVYCIINSTTASKNRFTINGTEYPLDLNTAASGYNESSLEYRINTSGYNTGSDIFEILYYNRDLEPHERKLVEEYLGFKWGLLSLFPPLRYNQLSMVSDIVKTGLDLWIDAANPVSGTTIPGMAPTSLNATLMGGATRVAESPSYFNINGSPQYIATTYNPNLDNNTLRTWEIWFWDNSPGIITTSGGNTNIITNYQTSTTPLSTLEITPSGTPRMVERNTAGSLVAQESTFVLTNSKWHHVVYVTTSTQQLLYINGVLNITTSRSGGVITSGQNIIIGGGILSRYQTCRIGLVRLYRNYALSGDEIQRHYRKDANRFGITL